MDCKETLEHISLLLDGELDNRAEEEVLSHLHKCWHCAEMREHETKLKSLIREKLDYQRKAPQILVNRILNTIEA